MRVVISVLLMCVGSVAMASQEVIATGTDNQAPKVEVNIPAKAQTPLIQTYHTEKGDLASVVTPQEGDSYFVVPPQQAYQTQYPQDREADVPVNDANWVLISW